MKHLPVFGVFLFKENDIYYNQVVRYRELNDFKKNNTSIHNGEEVHERKQWKMFCKRVKGK